MLNLALISLPKKAQILRSQNCKGYSENSFQQKPKFIDRVPEKSYLFTEIYWENLLEHCAKVYSKNQPWYPLLKTGNDDYKSYL